MRREKQTEKVDWSMLIMCLILAVSLWVNTITRPTDTYSAVGPEDEGEPTVVAEVVEQPEVDESTVIEELVEVLLPNYASKNPEEDEELGQDESTEEKVIYVICPNCGKYLKITELKDVHEGTLKQLETEQLEK